MFAFFQDIRHAIRTLSKQPGLALAATFTLAVGIGANVTVFSIVNGMLLRPLPFGERSDRVVTLHSTHPMQPEDWGWGDSELSYPDFLDLRAAGPFEGLGVYLSRSFTLAGEESAERVQGGSISPELFAMLGIEPMLGRTFVPEDAAAPGLETSVVLTHGLWERRYGADPAIVGRAIVVNEGARTVVGVMPPNFRFPERDELYMPLRLDRPPRSARNVNVVGVLRPGVTLRQAQAEVSAIAARLAEIHPDTNRGYGVRVLAFRESQVGPDEHALSITLMVAVGLVLLIACANVANLLFVRGAARHREVAVRAAMGASRGRLISIMLAESLLLVVIGAGSGLLASQWMLDFLLQSFPEELPYWLRFDADVRVILFTTSIAGFTALAIGLLPALRASRPNLATDLKEVSHGVSLTRSAQRLQSGLVAAQVALCLALLVGANLMIRSFLAMQTADLGFDHRPVLSMRTYLPGDAFDDLRARGLFFQRAADRLRELPGVAAAAATTSIPGDDGGSAVRLVVDGQASRDEDLAASFIAATAGLFDTLGVRLVEGRGLTDAEARDPDGHVAVLNAALATRLWPGESALGRRVGFRSRDEVSWFRIVGVAPDIHYEEIGEATDVSRWNVYLPYAVAGYRNMALLARAEGTASAATLVNPARQALRELHAGLPVYELMPMTERRRLTTWEPEFFGQMMGSFAAVALLLACVGVYALVSYAVRRRLPEIGVRLALGASPRDVVLLFVSQGGRIAAIGLTAGVALAAGLSRAMSGALWGIDPFDPLLFAGMGAALLVAVLGASYWPARRAARIDPTTALRVD